MMIFAVFFVTTSLKTWAEIREMAGSDNNNKSGEDAQHT
jgi:hypothetical protein